MKTLITFIIPLLVLSGCAPVFSDLQSARTVGKGNLEVTPGYSSYQANGDGSSDLVNRNLVFRASYGITDKIDFQLGYDYIMVNDFDEDFQVLGFGPKFNLLKDRISLFIPVGTELTEEPSEYWQMHPTLFLTWPAIQDRLDLTLSPKYLISFCEDCDNAFAFNFGAAVSKDLNKWAIRASYGMYFAPESDGEFLSQFSIGFSYNFRLHN